MTRLEKALIRLQYQIFIKDDVCIIYHKHDGEWINCGSHTGWCVKCKHVPPSPYEMAYANDVAHRFIWDANQKPRYPL